MRAKVIPLGRHVSAKQKRKIERAAERLADRLERLAQVSIPENGKVRRAVLGTNNAATELLLHLHNAIG